ncbi:DUF2735 domain-containing protein [Methylobacterium sp. J-076]|uniref:DUF2735 domain-containing protein n=1 Tax=Methylobacterium sp. J-076 TaxID=2836655 RepID=UPI001FB9BB6B|nr:DUF2735 domain-containing protein [Methylobacterium sp. J-076]MCJ2015211.1 DUF2735 domain-containing protein [Methylobacterium sp. J-076]
MGATDLREAAKVYDLAAFRRAQTRRQPTVAAKPTPAVTGGAWYHEAAIRDDDRTRGR